MPDQRITDLAAAATLHTDDWLVVVDTHDTSMDATGTTKKVTPSVVSLGISITTSQISNLGSWPGSSALVTLGTITTGTWQGSPIARTYLDATLVATTGSYADPAWITSLAGAKVTGNIAGNAASITGSITESQVTNLTIDLAAKEPTIAAGSGSQYWTGSKAWVTLNQAAVAGLTSASSPSFAGLTIGSLSGLLKGASGLVSAASAADLPTITLTGDVTGAAAGGSIVTAIGAGVINYPDIKPIAAASLLGNPTGSPATLSEISLAPMLGFTGASLRSRMPIWLATSPGTTLISSAALTSILTGASSIGSLTIPANTLVVGSRLLFDLFGTYTYTSGGAHALYRDCAEWRDYWQRHHRCIYHGCDIARLVHRYDDRRRLSSSSHGGVGQDDRHGTAHRFGRSNHDAECEWNPQWHIQPGDD